MSRTEGHTSKPRTPCWYIQHVWHDVERTRERDGLRELAKEYNGQGELDDGDFPNWQARYCACYWW